MGSAQSARRIQPGGARPAVPRRADLSRSPFLPTPPPARRRSFPSFGGGRRRRAGGAGGGACGGPPRGRRPAAAGRTSTVGGAPRPAPGRLGRPGGEGGSGGTARHPRARRACPPRVLQPPGSSSSPNPGAEGTGQPVAALSSLPVRPSRRAGGVCGGRAAPPTARPLSHLPPSLGGPGVGADCPQCAPGVVAPSGRGGSVGHAALTERSRAHGVGGDVGYPPDPS